MEGREGGEKKGEGGSFEENAGKGRKDGWRGIGDYVGVGKFFVQPENFPVKDQYMPEKNKKNSRFKK